MLKPNFPTVINIESKLRICQDMLYIYSVELRRLAVELKLGDLDQAVYDETIVAIERDKAHLVSEIQSLTEYSSEKEAA